MLLRSQRRAALVRPVLDGGVPQGRRHQPTHVLHHEHFGSEVLNVAKELPQQRPPRVLDRGPLARGTERLARRAAHDQVQLAGFEADVVHDPLGVQTPDVALIDLEVAVAHAIRVAVAPDRRAECGRLLHASKQLEPSRLIQADVEAHAAAEQGKHCVLSIQWERSVDA